MTFTTHSSGTSHFESTYGAAAIALQDHSRIMYEKRAGVPVQHWVTGIHASGMVVLLPLNESADAQKTLNSVHPAAVLSKAAGMVYEAFSETVDMEDDDQAALPLKLLSVAKEAEVLAAAA